MDKPLEGRKAKPATTGSLTKRMRTDGDAETRLKDGFVFTPAPKPQLTKEFVADVKRRGAPSAMVKKLERALKEKAPKLAK